MWNVNGTTIKMVEGEYGVDLPLTITGATLTANDEIRLTIKRGRQGNVAISLPSGYTVSTSVGGYGVVMTDSTVLPIVVRITNTGLQLVGGPSGNWGSTKINSTGYYNIQANFPVTPT